jgi:hypothetical protein
VGQNDYAGHLVTQRSRFQACSIQTHHRTAQNVALSAATTNRSVKPAVDEASNTKRSPLTNYRRYPFQCGQSYLRQFLLMADDPIMPRARAASVRTISGFAREQIYSRTARYLLWTGNSWHVASVARCGWMPSVRCIVNERQKCARSGLPQHFHRVYQAFVTDMI